MSSRLCVIQGCRELGEHLDDCRSERCKGCRPCYVESGFVCRSDRTGLEAILGDIGGMWPALAEEPDPVDWTTWTSLQWRPIPTSDPVRRQPWLWVSEAGAEELAKVLPMGIVRSSSGAGAGGRVSGSRESAAVTDLDLLDLLAASRQASLVVAKAGDPDQIGYLSVETELDFWVRDWAGRRGKGEGLPDPSVPLLASWLNDRLEWACDHHPGIDEFATKVGEVRSAVRRKLGLNAPPRELCKGVPCKSCDRTALYREGGLVSCGYCGTHYSDKEYREWVKLEAPYALARVRDGEIVPMNPEELRRMVA